MTVRDDRGDVKQTTTGFRDPRHHICQKQIPIPPILHSNTFLFYLNGWRGVCVDPYTDDFLKGILWVLNNNNSKLKSNCRQHVIDNFASKKIALKHIKLYKKIIKG